MRYSEPGEHVLDAIDDRAVLAAGEEQPD